MYKISDRCTPESVLLKENIISCNKTGLFKTNLIKYYIEADWQKFAQKYAYIDLILYCIFLALIMAQFWQIEPYEVYSAKKSKILITWIPISACVILVAQILKVIL